MRPRFRRAQCAVAFLAVISVCLRNPAYGQSAAAFPGAGWPVSTPQAEGLDPAKFAAAMNSMPSTALVIRNGKIIGTKGDIARPGPLYSASKGLLALLAGLLMEQGKITMDTLVPWSDRPTPPLANIRHFLTMTSDFNLTPHSPGDHYAYSNSGAIRYGQYMIGTFYPGAGDVGALRMAYLDKLGIQDPVTLTGSVSGWGGGGFIMSTRDFARVGYLILRSGVWNGERLLPQWFIDGLYVSQIPAHATPGGVGSGDVDNQTNVTPRMPGTYSWGWWLPHGDHGAEGSRSRTSGVGNIGAYGTSMYVLPKQDMILAGVNTSATYSGGRIPGWLIDQFADAVVTNTPPPAATPAIASVVNGASFGPGLAPSAWISIFGERLAPAPRTWRSDEIVGGRLPLQLDGVSVTMGGQAAAVYYVSPGQLNVQVPEGILGNAVPVQLTTPEGAAGTVAQIQAVAPGLFAYDVEQRRYAAAQHAADYRIVGKQGLYATAAPARPGETIILYGTGFGATSPQMPAGRVVTQAVPLAGAVAVWIGSVPAAVRWAGMSGAGLYQLNVVVPESLPNGDAAVVAEIGGIRTQPGLYITVER